MGKNKWGMEVEISSLLIFLKYMNCSDWIKRERRIRIKILNSSPIIKKKNIYRICQSCDEILLCHEESCPNCNSFDVNSKKLIFSDAHFLEEKIRCQYRFSNIMGEKKLIK